MNNDQKERHESYGMLQISRVSHGRGTTLYGSSIQHQETIQLRILPGNKESDNGHDWYFTEGREHIEIEMSQSQFSEAITSLNSGTGTPVTIKTLHGETMEEPPFKNKRIEFEEVFKERMVELQEKLNGLVEEATDILKNKKSINKSDREAILRGVLNLSIEISSNIPFISTLYNEQLDKTTKEAKAELEAFSVNKINQLGLQKLEELNQLIANGNEVGKIEHQEDVK